MHDPRGTYKDMARVYIGLGANLGDREAAIRRALDVLDADPAIDVVAVSTVRETDPVGYLDQPRFLNGAAALETELPPRELLERLLAVEKELGRERAGGPRFGPRTIDLDLLLYGEETIAEPGLTVPHPRLTERRFVLEPLSELDPSLALPDGRRVRELLASAVE
jgi:2-amino-4-hydroxy-6-hydroxymethyldihydropteridine diphosphokinase